ncbi:Enterochelin esterase [Corynebacterium occultum]|uniref:Enterochelin esterase n=2 Tax=Corynebacterium occultum TaxID=2675219 RepID=A0A6B8VYL7_9CORY|nr:Enterochelin esterase [Corynebacterium occultum]
MTPPMKHHHLLPCFPTETEVLEQLSWAGTELLEEFWREIHRRGTPIWDPTGVRATFFWRNPSGTIPPDGEPVHLHINRVSDGENHELGFMCAVPGTDIWVRTLDLSPTLQASYSFAPLGQHPGLPRHNHYPNLIDPCSSQPPLIHSAEGHGLSLLSGKLSPRQTEWQHPGKLRGKVIRGELPLGNGAGETPTRPCHLYLPDSHTPVALLTLFDAEIWFGHLNLPQALENAQELGRIPPVAVLGIENLDQADRFQVLGANPDFLSSLADTATTWAQQQAESAGIRLQGREGRLIAGQSLGGLSALLAAHLQPEVYGTAICQSPSLWWTPDGASTPRDFGSRSLDWIAEESALRPARSTQVHLDVGLREGLTLPRTHQLNQLLCAKGWSSQVNTYDGGHDFACWRGALIDQLAQSLAS